MASYLTKTAGERLWKRTGKMVKVNQVRVRARRCQFGSVRLRGIVAFRSARGRFFQSKRRQTGTALLPLASKQGGRFSSEGIRQSYLAQQLLAPQQTWLIPSTSL